MYAGAESWVSNDKHWHALAVKGLFDALSRLVQSLALVPSSPRNDLFDALSRLCSRWHCRRHRATGRAIRVHKRVPPTFIVDAVIVAVGVQRPDLSASF
jgi:uncharacterized membrane protein YccC